MLLKYATSQGMLLENATMNTTPILTNIQGKYKKGKLTC
jgi:hypothetical protein